MHGIKALVRVTSVLLVVASLVQAETLQSDRRVLKMGVVPQFDARRIHDVWEPLLQAVNERAGVSVTLQGSPSIPAFEKQLMAGVFDLVYLNPYHMIKAHRAHGYQPILRDVGRSLYGIVVVRKNSPIKEVRELDGRVIAFPAPNALGAALLPRAEFDRTYHIQFTPKYVKSHSSVYLNVMLGQAAAGGGVYKTLSQQPPEVRDGLRIIYKTPEVAPHPIAVHPRIDSATRMRIQQAFVALERTPEGRALFAGIPIKVLGQASMTDYQPLEAMNLERYYVPERYDVEE